jgi:septum formation topological specificity factor MinE
MTNERLAELQQMRVNIDDISSDIDNLNIKYDRWQIVGRVYGEELSSADVLCDLDGEILDVIKEYLKAKRDRLEKEFMRA